MRGPIVRELMRGPIVRELMRGPIVRELMRGPIVRELCVGRNRETNTVTLDDEFHMCFSRWQNLFIFCIAGIQGKAHMESFWS